MKKVPSLIAIATLCLGFTSLIAQEDNKIKNENAHVMITPEELVWIDGPDGLPSGAKMVVLEGNPSQPGPFTLRIKIPANYKIPAHWHPAIEHVTVLQGTLFMGDGDKLDESKGKKLSAGSYAVMQVNTHHFAWTGADEAIIQLHGVGPWGITYINPLDDPRKNTQ